MSLRYNLQVSRTINVSVDIIICIRIQVALPGYMFPGDMCPVVNAA